MTKSPRVPLRGNTHTVYPGRYDPPRWSTATRRKREASACTRRGVSWTRGEMLDFLGTNALTIIFGLLATATSVVAIHYARRMYQLERASPERNGVDLSPYIGLDRT